MPHPPPSPVPGKGVLRQGVQAVATRRGARQPHPACQQRRRGLLHAQLQRTVQMVGAPVAPAAGCCQPAIGHKPGDRCRGASAVALACPAHTASLSTGLLPPLPPQMTSEAPPVVLQAPPPPPPKPSRPRLRMVAADAPSSPGTEPHCPASSAGRRRVWRSSSAAAAASPRSRARASAAIRSALEKCCCREARRWHSRPLPTAARRASSSAGAAPRGAGHPCSRQRHGGRQVQARYTHAETIGFMSAS